MKAVFFIWSMLSLGVSAIGSECTESQFNSMKTKVESFDSYNIFEREWRNRGCNHTWAINTCSDWASSKYSQLETELKIAAQLVKSNCSNFAKEFGIVLGNGTGVGKHHWYYLLAIQNTISTEDFSNFPLKFQNSFIETMIAKIHDRGNEQQLYEWRTGIGPHSFKSLGNFIYNLLLVNPTHKDKFVSALLKFYEEVPGDKFDGIHYSTLLDSANDIQVRQSAFRESEEGPVYTIEEELLEAGLWKLEHGATNSNPGHSKPFFSPYWGYNYYPGFFNTIYTYGSSESGNQRSKLRLGCNQYVKNGGTNSAVVQLELILTAGPTGSYTKIVRGGDLKYDVTLTIRNSEGVSIDKGKYSGFRYSQRDSLFLDRALQDRVIAFMATAHTLEISINYKDRGGTENSLVEIFSLDGFETMLSTIEGECAPEQDWGI